MAEAILKLNTKKIRRCIEIDEQQFELLSFDNLTLPEAFELKQTAERIKGVHKPASEYTVEEIQDLSDALDLVVTRIIPGIGDTLGKLDYLQKTAIMNSFLALPVKSTETKTDAGNTSDAPADSAGSLEEQSGNGSGLPSDSLVTARVS